MQKVRDLSNEQLKKQTYILIVSTAYNIHIHLAFEGLGAVEKYLLFAFPEDLQSSDVLQNAVACILVRDLYFKNIYRIAYRASIFKIPLYLYLDDNYPLMAEEGEAPSFYLPPTFRFILKSFSGVLLSNTNLINYFVEKNIHETLLLFPLIYRKDIIVSLKQDNKSDDVFTFSFMAGCGLRMEQFKRTVLPALNRLAQKYKLRLICPISLKKEFIQGALFEIIGIPFYYDYQAFIIAYAKFKPQALIHINPIYKNTPYKTLNALANAALTGSILIVNREAPYTQIPEDTALLVSNVGNIEKNWCQALENIITCDNILQMHRNSLSYCNREFSGAQNESVINLILHNGNNHIQPTGRLNNLPFWPIIVNRIWLDWVRLIKIFKYTGMKGILKKIQDHTPNLDSF